MSRSALFTAVAPATQSSRRRSSSGGGRRRRCRHGKIRRFCKRRHPRRTSRSRSN